MTKTQTGAVLVLVLLVGIVAGAFSEGLPAAVSLSQDKPIKIGFVGPLSGDAASFGEIEKNAMELALQEINASGGSNGRPIEATYEDGKCNGKDALSAAKKLVEVHHINILLVSCSNEVLAVADYAEKHKVLLLTSYASASKISDAGDYVFRISYTNKDMARQMADVAYDHGTRVAMISEVSEFATDLRDLFVADAVLRGHSVVTSENFQPGSKDMRTEITKILAQKPDVIVVNPDSSLSGAAVLKQLQEAGFTGTLVGNFFGGNKTIQALSEAQGMLYVSDPVFSESEIKQEVYGRYETQFGEKPDLEWPLGARYDAVYVLKRAFDAVGDNPTKVKEYFYGMPGFTGVLGTFHFDAKGDITGVEPSVAKIENFTSVAAE